MLPDLLKENIKDQNTHTNLENYTSNSRDYCVRLHPDGYTRLSADIYSPYSVISEIPVSNQYKCPVSETVNCLVHCASSVDEPFLSVCFINKF